MWILFVAGFYLTVLIVMLILEDAFVYPRSTAADHWEDPPDLALEEVTFSASDGNTIHAWYRPQPDCKDVFLICHGNAGNLSMRGNGLLGFHELLTCNVLIFDYPATSRAPASRVNRAGDGRNSIGDGWFVPRVFAETPVHSVLPTINEMHSRIA